RIRFREGNRPLTGGGFRRNERGIVGRRGGPRSPPLLRPAARAGPVPPCRSPLPGGELLSPPPQFFPELLQALLGRFLGDGLVPKQGLVRPEPSLLVHDYPRQLGPQVVPPALHLGKPGASDRHRALRPLERLGGTGPPAGGQLTHDLEAA